MKINEIFCSIQGEGHFTGVPAVFIRTSGCNLRCHFCDTNHEDGWEMSVEEIVVAAASYKPRHAVITGGEPALQCELPKLIDALHEIGFFVQIETNGTRSLPANIDWVTCSPKSPVKDLKDGRNTCVVTAPHELKVVYEGQDLSELETQFHPRVWSLQPCDTGDTKRNKEYLDASIRYVISHPKWRLSLQTHKLIGVK